MTPLDFLAAVLPPSGFGHYCVVELSTKKLGHVYVEKLEEIEEAVERWGATKLDIYIAMATFKKAGSRKAENANFVRSLFIDMDGYATKKEAAAALSAFLDTTGLSAFGTPWIVASGGGLHCYWPFHEAVPVESWLPVAENFKRLCKQEALTIDMTVTADAARVLRIPGTMNHKAKYVTPRPVKIMAAGDSVDFDEIAKHIREKLTALPAAPEASNNVFQIEGVRPTAAAPTATGVKMFENSETRFKPIWLATQAGRGCGQIAAYVTDAAQEGMEPLWRAVLSIAKPCADGMKASIWLSKMHPYADDRMRQKLNEIKGPYPCVKFDSENPGVCTKCKHWGKITNPLALGRETVVDNTEKEIALVAPNASEVVGEEVIKVKRPVPPKGFSYGAKGGVYCEKMVEDGDGIKVKKQVMILPFDLFVIDILSHTGDHTVHMLAMRPDGPLDVTMPSKAVVSKDETLKSLAQQNIIASFGAGNDVNLFAYIRACVEQASTNKSTVKVPDSCGWQDDNSFVLGGRVFTKHAKPFKVPMPGLENLTANTEPCGTLENWRKFINMLIQRKMYAQLTVMLAGAAAPFMRFTGLYGMTFHCASTDSGTGKSLGLEAAASVWGHPVHYRTGKGTSPVAMQQRLGLLHTLPLITDEITSKNRNDFEWFPAFLLDMSEGRGKERMESGSNKERLNLSTWMTTCLMSSNTNAVDYLTGERKHASEGELRRLLEFVLNDKLEWTAEEVEVIKSLQENFGIAGFMLAEYMAKNFELFKPLATDVVQRMYLEYKATNDERYWMAGIGAIVTAGIVMGSKHAKIVDLPMTGIIDYLHSIVNRMRTSMKLGARTAEDVLNAYTRDFYGNFVIIRESNGLVTIDLGYDDATKQAIDWKEIPRSRISGRVEHGFAVGYIDYFIEEQLMKAYCSSMSFGYDDFKKQIERVCKVEYVKKDMLSRTKGPAMRVNAMRICRRIDESDSGINDLLSVAAA